MNIELYLREQKSHTAYAPLGSIQSPATPVKDSFVFYNSRYYIVRMVVLATNRVVAFVDEADGQQLGIVKTFE